jgi:hypothetical protein
MMSPGIRKLMLTIHVASSVGWLGAIAAYIALNVPALAGDDEQTVRAAYLMMDVVMWYALLPLATASLVTGIVQALGSPWGLFRGRRQHLDAGRRVDPLSAYQGARLSVVEGRSGSQE